MVDKKQWFKEFYQIKDGCQCDGFYASKRRAKVILEEVSEPKYKMYEAVVIAIEPLEEFEIKGVRNCLKYVDFLKFNDIEMQAYNDKLKAADAYDINAIPKEIANV